MVDIMEGKSIEKKVESEPAQDVEETKQSATSTDPCDNICETEDDRRPSSNGAVTNTVHVQHAHYPSNVVQTVLPRASSEQSKVRILTRTPAVQCLSSPPSEESEDIPQENELQGVKHQSSKDESGSDPPSLSSSRDSSFDYTDSTGTDLNEFIVKTLKNQRDKKMLLKLEKDFHAFISDPRRVFLQYPPMTSYHRMIVHRVAAYFGLDHNVDQTGKCIIINKCPNTRFPEVRFTDLIREDSEEDPSPKLILKRQNSSIDESAPPERNSSYSRRTLEDKKSKSIEEREEEYVKARARIFNHGSLSSQSSGESALSGLRDTSIDDESENLGNDQNIENVADKTSGIPQPAVKVLTNSSRSPEKAASKLTQDVSSNLDTSSSASSTTVTTTVTDSKFDSNLQSDSPDTTTVLAEGAPLVAGNLPPSDVASRSKLVGTAGMIPLLSPNQTGGVVWTLPENQGSYSSGPGSLFAGPGTGSQVVAPEGYQAATVGMQQGLGTMQTYFYPGQIGQAGQSYQPQPQRQPTPPQQQTQSGFPSSGLPMTSPYGPQSVFPIYQSRLYGQQDLEIGPQQPTVSQGSPHGIVVPSAGSPSPSFQDINSQLAGISLSQLEQQENQMFQKQRPSGSTYSPTCTQTFSAGQPVQYVVYRHNSGAMVAQPIPSQGQATSGYLYSSANPQGYTQPPYNPQMYNQQVYSQQPFNQPFAVAGDQTMLGHRSGAHTPPTPPPSASPMGTSPAFMPHVPTMPGTPPRQQFSTPVMNAPLAQVPARLVSQYPMQGQQLIHMPGTQQMYTYSQPYSVGQTRTVQQPPRFKPYSEKGHSKHADIYSPDAANQRRPSPSGSPRGNVSAGNQNRRVSGGVAGKGHSKNDGQRSQHQQVKGKQKHKRNQHRHSADSARKQPHVGPSGTETDLTSGAASRVLEVYDVTSNSRDLHQVVEDLRRAGAQIKWDEKTSPSAGNSSLTAKATFSSPYQAEQALRTNSNPNYKLRRCSAETPVKETLNY